MDMITILLIIIVAILGLGGTFGTYWRLSQQVSRLVNENKELRKKIQELEKIEGKLNVIEELLLEKNNQLKTKSEQRGKQQKYEDIDEEYINMKIYVLYRQGKSIREIARQLNLSKSTVHRRLKKILESKPYVKQ